MLNIDKISQATAAYREAAAPAAEEIASDRLGFIRDAMKNIVPILDLNAYEIREAMRVSFSEHPEPIILFTNKAGNRGFYLDEGGVYAKAEALSEPKRAEAGFAYYPWLNETIMDDFVFVHPKWLTPEAIQARLLEVEKEIEARLNVPKKSYGGQGSAWNVT